MVTSLLLSFLRASQTDICTGRSDRGFPFPVHSTLHYLVLFLNVSVPYTSVSLFQRIHVMLPSTAFLAIGSAAASAQQISGRGVLLPSS